MEHQIERKFFWIIANKHRWIERAMIGQTGGSDHYKIRLALQKAF
jgi:hypothetical protein